MFKKNLIGIVIVLLVFAGFYAGYSLGKGSGSSSPGMRRGGASSGTVPSSPRPSAQEQESIRPTQEKTAPANTDTDTPSAGAAKTAWAEPLTSSENGNQTSENRQQGKRRNGGANGDSPKGRSQEEQPIPSKIHGPSASERQASVQDDAGRRPSALPEEGTLSQTFYGTVFPFAEANVQSRQGGTITALNGKEGVSVAKGELLVSFDDRDTQLQLQQASSSKKSASQQVQQAESNFNTVKANVGRYQKLFKDGFLSKQQLDESMNQLESARSSLSSANESVKQAVAQIQLIENSLRDFRVNAPISGVITAKNYNLQEVYRSGDVIYHLIDIDQVYVDVEIPETYIGKVRQNMPVTVFFDALEGREFQAWIETILPTGTADNRSFVVKALVENPAHLIKPGMFARVNMQIGEAGKEPAVAQKERP